MGRAPWHRHRLRAGRPEAVALQGAGDGHGLDAHQHRVHRRDRRRGRRQGQGLEITEAAMRGEIKDFAESLRRRVALLKGVPAEALEQVYTEKLRLNPGAERLITTAQAAGIKVLLVSGGFTFFTDRLRERLKLDSAHANTLEIDNGVLTGRVLGDILDADAKAVYLREFARTHGATKEQVIAMGDGANDLKMLGAAGFGGLPRQAAGAAADPLRAERLGPGRRAELVRKLILPQ
ncbi:phosphoserine phosphatase SerB [Achromobacter xylosoxidans]